MTNQGKDRDGDLSARIERAREATKPPPGRNIAQKYNHLSLAWRMTLELVVGAGLGAAIGWGLDELTGLTPLFLLVFGLLGFVAGVKVVMRTAQEASEARDRTEGEDEDGRSEGR
ncbi:MAG: AtpZ/AtpI family protein [Pseudomonadota bacterium]